MTKVRQDQTGLYIQSGGYVARPGPVNGYGHAYRMDDGGLQPGDAVKSRHVSGTPLNVITLPNGYKTRWHHEGPDRDRGLYAPTDKDRPENFDKDGYKIFAR